MSMNKINIYILKFLRLCYNRIDTRSKTNVIPILELEDGNNVIAQLLTKDEPCMIARYGATELSCIFNFLTIKKQDRNIWRYIRGETSDWWWNPKLMKQMEQWSGFFPPTEEKLELFCNQMLYDSKSLDVLAVLPFWESRIQYISNEIPSHVQFLRLPSLDPFLFSTPWSQVLKGKSVVVVHPFAELIESQYARKEELFDDKNVLPDFQLRIVKAVQSLGGNDNGFLDWFEALEWMKNEMDKAPYDIALIGCGAYGFPLAAHAKRTGHQAVHIGGSLQLMFGIKGKRWENPEYAIRSGLSRDGYIRFLNNPAWVKPEQYVTEELKNVDNSAPYL